MLNTEILTLPKAYEARVRRVLRRAKIADLPFLKAAVGVATGDWRRAAISTRIEELARERDRHVESESTAP